MQDIQYESAAAGEEPLPMAIDSSTAQSRLGDLPFELRNLLVNFMPLAMRAVLAHVPQFHIRSDDALRGRKLLCEWASEHGYLDLLKWAHQRGYPLLQLRDGKRVSAAAAKGGQLAVLQWLRQIRCRWGAQTCVDAAGGNHLEVLQWARERGCPWDKRATFAASQGGHLAVLQWLRANGCEWDNRVTLEAARCGHLEVLQWALASGCPLHPHAAFASICVSGDMRMVQWALQQLITAPCTHGNAPGLTLEILRYLRKKRPNLAEDFPLLKPLATHHLARVGDLTGLQWARENGYFVPEDVCWGASEGGQLKVLKWVHQSGFSTLNVYFHHLVQGDHLECLKWAVAMGKHPSEGACAFAAQCGHLSVLQWLRDEINCDWDGRTLALALAQGHWEVFEWAKQHGCPVDARVFEAAVQGGYAEVLQWAFECAGERINLDPKWCRFAANAQVLKVLRAHGCEWSEESCSEYAWRGDLEMLQWAVRNGCPWDARTCTEALKYGHMYLLKWAVENGGPMDAETREKWSAFDLNKEFTRLLLTKCV